MMKMKVLIFLLCMVSLPAFAGTVLLNDPFSDGDRIKGADAQDAQWWITSGGTLAVANDAVIGSGNSLQLTCSGSTSQRRLVANFTSADLANTGDSITLSFDFNIFGTGSSDRGFRFGLFDSEGTLVNVDGTAYTDSMAAGDDTGYLAGISTGSYTKGYLYNEVASDTTFMGGSGSMVILSSNDSFGAISNNAKHTAVVTVTKTDAGIQLDTLIDGTSLISGGDTQSLTTIFDEVGFSGIGAQSSFAIDNVKVEYSPVPEPATMILIGLGLLAVRSRRK